MPFYKQNSKPQAKLSSRLAWSVGQKDLWKDFVLCFLVISLIASLIGRTGNLNDKQNRNKVKMHNFIRTIIIHA